jgi:outer membrane biosynthesis protein TonB
MGLSAGEFDLPGAPELADDDPDASPFETTAPIEDGLAAASTEPERGGDDPAQTDDPATEEDQADGVPGEPEPAEDDALGLAALVDPEPEPEPEADADPVSTAPAEPREPATTTPTQSATADVYDRSSSSGTSSGTAPASTTTTSSSSSSSGTTQRSSSSSSSGSSSGSTASTSDGSAPATAGGASIEVLGATSYVVGSDGRRPGGDLPAGTYEVFAQPNDSGDYISLGVHMLVEGEKMQFRCGFGSCRRIQ